MNDELKELYALLDLTSKEKPKQADITNLRQHLTVHPEHSKVLGNLSRQLQVQVIDNAMPKNYGARESLDEYCNLLRRDLGFADATFLERLMIQHIVLCWLRLHLAELRYEMLLKNDVSFATGEYWEKKLSYNQRRYLRAVETLAKVRRLMKEPKSPAFNLLLAQQINNR